MKLCKDCKHRGSWDRCESPQAYNKIDYVTGKKEKLWDYCRTQREDPWPINFLSRSCGTRARWFEPKEEVKNA